MVVTEEQIKDIVCGCLIEEMEDIINSAQRAIANKIRLDYDTGK